MDQKKLRVALFGRFYSESCESIESQKDKLRQEAKNRNYEVVDEFWEDDLSLDLTLEERPEMKRFITSVWTNVLKIDGLFLPDYENLSVISRREHVTLMVLFEQNDIAVITIDTIYRPDDWMVALSF
jgi:DNA invertase Pin-like site-specific DNA recombinase